MARNNERSPSLPYLSHSLKLTANCVCVCFKKKKMALLVFFITVNTADTPAPLPFILISILSDKPPQSHSRSVCTPPPTTHLVDPPQNPSEAATVLLCLPPQPPLLAPSPCPGRCWLAGTEACLDRNARGEEGRERRMEGGSKG